MGDVLLIGGGGAMIVVTLVLLFLPTIVAAAIRSYSLSNIVLIQAITVGFTLIFGAFFLPVFMLFWLGALGWAIFGQHKDSRRTSALRRRESLRQASERSLTQAAPGVAMPGTVAGAAGPGPAWPTAGPGAPPHGPVDPGRSPFAPPGHSKPGPSPLGPSPYGPAQLGPPAASPVTPAGTGPSPAGGPPPPPGYPSSPPTLPPIPGAPPDGASPYGFGRPEVEGEGG